MERLMSDLENWFENHPVDWFAVACSLGVEQTVCTQLAEQGEAFSPAQLASRR